MQKGREGSRSEERVIWTVESLDSSGSARIRGTICRALPRFNIEVPHNRDRLSLVYENSVELEAPMQVEDSARSERAISSCTSEQTRRAQFPKRDARFDPH